ncbi:3-oxo-5-alpha-steroid 4-dehydrogenase-domain-containing protein [Mycena maculata]|uniref:3-oxo-5-alpha-steroid 4-dehydrogenase-domain-containing protein n=1 Tax=Mycena maculata TaxID=230809 RepID=A0AAD7JAF4_9AGAR|nr:3-oxo-5-alpha-steroid 4-dehydrogenase-domain-containing protein [Mycena maculata]
MVPTNEADLQNSRGNSKDVFSASLSLPLTLTFPQSPPPTIRDVNSAIQQAHPSFYISRQKSSKALSDDSAILFSAAGDAELTVGDLGPQVQWRTVFLVEYAGPLIIHPLIYHLLRLVYGVDVEHSALQKLVYAMVMINFVKRELETMFIHQFSHATMRFKNIFKNSAHYYLLSGLLLAYDVYRPAFSAPAVAGTWHDGSFLGIAWAVWGFAQLSNFRTHLTTRALRPAGTMTRAVPMGYGFSWPFNLAFPNYFFDLLGWGTVWAMSGSWAVGLFLAVSGGQMVLWAQKKHAAYKREFGDKYPRGRKALFPWIL